MARARNIKPKFFQNDELGELPPLARLLFIGMWTIADFRGCLEFRPKRIKTQLLPYDECDIEVLTNALDKSGFISIYSVQGQRYVKIIKFERHQTPHKNERESGSEIPDITEKDNEISELKKDEINPDKNGTTHASNCSLNPSNCSLNPEPLSLNPEAEIASAIVVPSPDIPPQKEVSEKETVAMIFSYWQKIMESPRSQLDAKRATVIKTALKRYTPREVCEAILGCSRTPHNMGQNESGTKYNGLGLILRDSDHIERFMQACKATPKTNTANMSIEQINEMRMRELAGEVPSDDPMTIDMEE